MRKPWNNFESAFHYYYEKPFMKVGPKCTTYPYYHLAKGERISFTDYLDVVFDDLNETIP